MTVSYSRRGSVAPLALRRPLTRHISFYDRGRGYPSLWPAHLLTAMISSHHDAVSYCRPHLRGGPWGAAGRRSGEPPQLLWLFLAGERRGLLQGDAADPPSCPQTRASPAGHSAS